MHSAQLSTLTDVASRKRQRTYPLSDMVRVIEGLDPRLDTWCTQAEFFTRNRRLTSLARIDLQFIDLDTYRVPWLVEAGERVEFGGEALSTPLHTEEHHLNQPVRDYRRRAAADGDPDFFLCGG